MCTKQHAATYLSKCGTKSDIQERRNRLPLFIPNIAVMPLPSFTKTDKELTNN